MTLTIGQVVKVTIPERGSGTVSVIRVQPGCVVAVVEHGRFRCRDGSGKVRVDGDWLTFHPRSKGVQIESIGVRPDDLGKGSKP